MGMTGCNMTSRSLRGLLDIKSYRDQIVPYVVSKDLVSTDNAFKASPDLLMSFFGSMDDGTIYRYKSSGSSS